MTIMKKVYLGILYSGHTSRILVLMFSLSKMSSVALTGVGIWGLAFLLTHQLQHDVNGGRRGGHRIEEEVTCGGLSKGC